jgi:putative spermidine/putrescine transport system ATP-binding protein
MDEPLGALDRKLREQLQLEVKHIQKELGTTVIYVTHDQGEALSMADRIAVLHEGRLQQIGPPDELYERPSNPFVADFVGDTNFLKGVLNSVNGSTCTVKLSGGPIVRARRPEVEDPALGPVRIAIRPERVKLSPGAGDSPDAHAGVLEEIVYGGGSLACIVRISSDVVVTSRVTVEPSEARLRIGQDVSVSWLPEHARTYSG